MVHVSDYAAGQLPGSLLLSFLSSAHSLALHPFSLLSPGSTHRGCGAKLDLITIPRSQEKLEVISQYLEVPSAGCWQLDLQNKVDTEFPGWLNKVGVET